MNKIRKNYLLVRYEDVVISPDISIPAICNFLKINIEEKMMVSSGKPSSYDKVTRKGFDKSLAFKWKESLSKIDKIMIKMLTYNSLKGYSYI